MLPGTARPITLPPDYTPPEPGVSQAHTSSKFIFQFSVCRHQPGNLYDDDGSCRENFCTTNSGDESQNA